MAIPRAEEIRDLATKYSKKQLFGLTQRGEIDPATAIMAGMMRDRIVQSEMIEQMPETNVFQDTFTPQQDLPAMPMGQPQDQLAQMRQPVEGQPQMAYGPQPQTQTLAEGGLASIPFDDSLFGGGYAGGGIIAFSNGNLVRSPRDKTTAYFQSLQDFNPSEFRGIRGAELSSMMRNTRGLKVDPVTGNPISLGEFIRAVDSGKIQIPEDFSVTPEAPSFAQALQTTPQAATVDDAAEMAKFARQGTGVPMGSTGLAALQNAPPPGPQPRPAAPAVAATAAEAEPKSFDDFLNLVKTNMPQGSAGDGMRKGIEEDRKLKAKEKEQAGWMRLAEAGLGIMGGESPYALVNIGKGATAALKGYAEDLREQKKLDREDRKILADLDRADRAEGRENFKLATELRENALNRASNETRARIAAEASNFNAQATRDNTALMRGITLADAAAKGIRDNLTKRAENPLDPIAKILKTNPNYIEEQAEAARRRALQDAGLNLPSMNIDPDLQRRADAIISGGR